MNGVNLSPCQTPGTASKKSVLLSGEQTIAFVSLHCIIIAVTVSLGRQYANGICFIFPLFMKLNALEKSTNWCYLEIFCAYSFDDSVDSHNLRESIDSFESRSDLS